MAKGDIFIKCGNCGKQFKRNTIWHRFCCQRCRLIAWIKAQVQE